MTKKTITTLLAIFMFGIFSCSDDIDHKINGQWQLKTIDENGVISQVDTVFYSFQRGMIFSFTTLVNPDSTSISYGYISFPAENELLISLDTTRNEDGYLYNVVGDFKELSGWDNLYNLFTIESIDNKNMVLSSDGKIYSFKKH
jgi:hypothetical protein